MNTVHVAFTWLDLERSTGLSLPSYETAQASGMDVAACVNEPVQIGPGAIELICTGFAVAIPAGFEIQVRPRSGLAIRHGVTVINAPGTIDADYRGEVKIGLINLGTLPFTVQRGDRIAQLVLAPVARAELVQRDTLEETARGNGGFGSTGLR